MQIGGFSEADWEIVTLNAIIFVRMTLLPVCCVCCIGFSRVSQRLLEEL